MKKVFNRDARKRDEYQCWQRYDEDEAAENGAAAIGQDVVAAGQIPRNHDGEEGRDDVYASIFQSSIPFAFFFVSQLYRLPPWEKHVASSPPDTS